MRHVALLRGINVGPSNRVGMSELRAEFEKLGLRDVRTLLASGNVLFSSDEPEAALLPRIETALRAAFGFRIPVLLRTDAEIEAVRKAIPYSADEIAAAEAAAAGVSFYVAFLGAPPTGADRAALSAAADVAGDRFAVVGRELYVLFKDTMRTSTLAARLDRLSTPATTRNGNTVDRIAEAFRAQVRTARPDPG